MIPPIHPNDAGRVRCCVDGCGSYGGATTYIALQDGTAYPAHGSPRYCDGPACMGWRWLDTPAVEMSKRAGYCGRAGE